MPRVALAIWLSIALSMVVSQDTSRAVESISTRTQFDELARMSYEGRFVALPHLMFAIDRADGGRIYYINSQRYRFHQEFLTANYLTLERGQKFYEHNYRSSSRRFVLGTIARYEGRDRFTFEFWEGDLTTADLLREAFQRISASFFAPVYFKPNSSQQEEIAATVKEVPHLSASELDAAGDYVPLHLARNIGVLRIIDRITDETVIDRNEILILREPPLQLTPCSGVITTTFGTPLAHVNLLARGWGIPNAYIKGAAETFKLLVGKFVYFETREDGFTLRPAEASETAEYGRRMAQRSDLITPPADLDFRELTPLANQRRGDARRFGAKAANLGEVTYSARAGVVHGISVPPGFSVPFFYYSQFIRENGLEDAIVEMLANDRFNHDPAYRKQRLAEMRARIERGRLDPAFARAVASRVQATFGTKGVFARSSTNAEDLENFSGAGLYTTVPNVLGRESLLEAIRKVWASIWNYEAYEARESAGINHAAVYPSVLIQEGVPAEAAGVLITTNPFDKEDNAGVYINAKRGLGIRVVSGQRVPEQLIYHVSTNAVRVLTRSGDDTMLAFDERGGVREVRIEAERRVLTDKMVRRLASAALEIKQAFNGRDQDIEWATVGSRIYIVQSRPFVEEPGK